MVSSSFVAAQQPPGHLQRRSGQPKWGGVSTGSPPSTDASPSSDGAAAGCATPSCACCGGGGAAQQGLSSPRTTKRPPRAPAAEETPREQTVEAQLVASPSPPRDEPGTGARRRWQMALSRMDGCARSPASGEAHEVPSPQRGVEDRSEASLEHDEFAALLQQATREWRAADEEADEFAQQTLTADGGGNHHLQHNHRPPAQRASPPPTTLLQAGASLPPPSPPPPADDALRTPRDDARTVHFQEPLES